MKARFESDSMTVSAAVGEAVHRWLRCGLWPSLLLEVGDRVEIRVVDVEAVDEPESVQTLEKGGENVDAMR